MNSYWRCVYALRVYQEGKYREVVVSGAAAAGSMRTFLISQGIPSDRIRLEDTSADTHESAINVKKLLGEMPGRRVLLTSDYHMFRAWRTFSKAGLTVFPRPFPDVRKRAAQYTGRWPAFIDLVTESAKIGYYYARGWM